MAGRQGSDDMEGQIVYELQGARPSERHPGDGNRGVAGAGQAAPGAVPGTVRRVLNDEMEATGDSSDARTGIEAAAAGGGGPGVLYGCLGDALGGLGEGGLPGNLVYGSAAAAIGAEGAALTTAGLQQFSAQLPSGGVTPVPEQQAAPGRYAGYEDSVESKQAARPPGLATAGSSSAGADGFVDGNKGGAAGGSTRPRVPPLRFSRMNVAELLHSSDAEGASQQGQHRLLSMSRQDADSISRLAASMHRSGLGAVTPADIRSALSGGDTLFSVGSVLKECAFENAYAWVGTLH